MVLRWTAAAFLLTEKSFCKIQWLSGSLDVESGPGREPRFRLLGRWRNMNRAGAHLQRNLGHPQVVAIKGIRNRVPT